MNDLKEILRELHSGRTSFSPENHSKQQIIAFQPTAAHLLDAFKCGYIEDCRPHQTSRFGGNYYDLVTVGQLTKKGEVFLDSTKT